MRASSVRRIEYEDGFAEGVSCRLRMNAVNCCAFCVNFLLS